MKGCSGELLSFKSYEISPEKEWVIFLHGIGGDNRTFSLQLKAFKPHFNLLLPDLRGHGESNRMTEPPAGKYSLNVIAEDVFFLMEHLHIEKAHFVGGSFGATLIRIMQEIHPEKFKKVVAAGGVLRLKPSIYMVFKTGELLSSYVDKYFLYKIMAYFIMPRKNHARSRRVFLDTAKTIDPKEYVSWIVMLSEAKRRLNKLFGQPFKTPTLLIVGSQDHAFLKDSIRFCKQYPATLLQIIPACGHLSNIERFPEFNKLALNFLMRKE